MATDFPADNNANGNESTMMTLKSPRTNVTTTSKLSKYSPPASTHRFQRVFHASKAAVSFSGIASKVVAF
ncbi:hypothetical protein NQ318_005282 [Aromia moschata]|uniref:Uncharacterized protein n=1 Tax=Aromia moschata TaxID=1265417 RepID=A0AAV8XQC7_9CUCU|nr:hypothetical protein NQ318_005282 [Aromia moschata]